MNKKCAKICVYTRRKEREKRSSNQEGDQEESIQYWKYSYFFFFLILPQIERSFAFLFLAIFNFPNFLMVREVLQFFAPCTVLAGFAKRAFFLVFLLSSKFKKMCITVLYDRGGGRERTETAASRMAKSNFIQRRHFAKTTDGEWQP